MFRRSKIYEGISTLKNKENVIFIIICAILVTSILLIPNTQKLMEGMDPLTIIITLFGSLIYPGIGYGIYLIIKKIKGKNKPKEESKKSI